MERTDMTESIIVAVITGLFTMVGSVIAVITTSNKNNAVQNEQIEQLRAEFRELKTDVKSHNNHGLQIAKLETRVEILERKVG